MVARLKVIIGQIMAGCHLKQVFTFGLINYLPNALYVKFKSRPNKCDEIIPKVLWCCKERGGGCRRIKVSVVYQDLSETGGTLAECFSFHTYYNVIAPHWPLSPPPSTSKFYPQVDLLGFVVLFRKLGPKFLVCHFD